MGKIFYPDKAKLVIPTLYSDENIYREIYENLIDIFGETDYVSSKINFTYTDFYNKEMGLPISRVIFSFKKLINIEELSAIKIKTNELELSKLINDNRKVNLDPGYVDAAKFVLATTKDYSHRIYIGNGIFSECTLTYRKKSFIPYEWTYVDYKSDEYIKILNEIRNIYMQQIKLGLGKNNEI